MIVYRSSVTAADQMAGADPDAGQAAMELWGKWMSRAGAALVDGGGPLNEVRVVGSGSGGHIGGYSILEAESADAVEGLLQDHPHFHSPDANIAVLEVVSLPGM